MKILIYRCNLPIRILSITIKLNVQSRARGQMPSHRYRHTAVTLGTSMFVFGGIDCFQKRFNDLYMLDFGRLVSIKIKAIEMKSLLIYA